MSKSKRHHLIRKLAIGPAMIVSAIIFVLLSLLGLLNFNPPSISDSSADPADNQTDTANAQANLAAAIEPALAQEPVDAAQQTLLEPLPLIDVLIDGDVYWVGTGKQNETVVRETQTIGDITEACGRTKGDDSGIRIRVTRTFQATARAERALVSALTQAGLTDDEIDLRRTLVER